MPDPVLEIAQRGRRAELYMSGVNPGSGTGDLSTAFPLHIDGAGLTGAPWAIQKANTDISSGTTPAMFYRAGEFVNLTPGITMRASAWTRALFAALSGERRRLWYFPDGSSNGARRESATVFCGDWSRENTVPDGGTYTMTFGLDSDIVIDTADGTAPGRPLTATPEAIRPYTSNRYQVSFGLMDDEQAIYHPLSGRSSGGHTVAINTTLSPVTLEGVQYQQSYPTSTACSLALTNLLWGVDARAYQTIALASADSEVAAALMEDPDNYAYAFEIRPEPVDEAFIGSELATITPTIMGHGPAYYGAIQEVAVPTSITSPFEVALTRPTGFNPNDINSEAWLIISGGSATETATVALDTAGGSSASSLRLRPGIYRLSYNDPDASPAARYQPSIPAAFTVLKMSAAPGTATNVKVLYGDRVGAPR